MLGYRIFISPQLWEVIWCGFTVFQLLTYRVLGVVEIGVAGGAVIDTKCRDLLRSQIVLMLSLRANRANRANRNECNIVADVDGPVLESVSCLWPKAACKQGLPN